MNTNSSAEERLSALLRAARPQAEPSPGFQSAVWRRIESGDARVTIAFTWLNQFARLFQVPRLAFATVAVVVIIAGGLGALQGLKTGERQARERYISSVNPSYLAH